MTPKNKSIRETTAAIAALYLKSKTSINVLDKRNMKNFVTGLILVSPCPASRLSATSNL